MTTVAVALGVLGASAPARAALSKAACIAAFDEAQQARRAGRLATAREQLLSCSREECPAILRADCGDVLRQVDASQPSIVLRATDPSNADIHDVSVELDGRSIATTLDGRAIPVDPGQHEVVFHRAPWEPARVSIMLAEGEKARLVRATFGPGVAAGTRLPSEPPLRAAEPLPPASLPPERRSVAGWGVPAVFAAAGIGALVFAGASRLALGDEADELRGSCAPHCPRADRDRLSSELVTVNVVLAGGIAALAFGVASWFVLSPKRPSSPTVARWGGIAW